MLRTELETFCTAKHKMHCKAHCIAPPQMKVIELHREISETHKTSFLHTVKEVQDSMSDIWSTLVLLYARSTVGVICAHLQKVSH